MFKKLEINIPFVDVLAQMPNYVKFMKEIMSNKKKLEAYGTVNLTKNCNAIIQQKLPEKLKDSSSFTMPCIIGEHTFNKALCVTPQPDTRWGVKRGCHTSGLGLFNLFFFRVDTCTCFLIHMHNFCNNKNSFTYTLYIPP